MIGDEREIVRVRTNYRQGEDLYLYHSRATPDHARAVFMDYLKTANEIHDIPSGTTPSPAIARRMLCRT